MEDGSSSLDGAVAAPQVDSGPAPPAPRLCSDGWRAMIGFIFSLVFPFSVGFVLGWVSPSIDNDSDTTILLTLLGWTTFAIVYVLLTLRTFTRVGPAEFRLRMAARASTRQSGWQRMIPGGDGPSFAVEAAVVAFVVVLLLPHVESIRIDEWLLVPVTLTILLTSWTLAVVSYSLHYAQRDLENPGLEFPGDRTNTLSDYLYFSIAVATTFGATDVNITRPGMRRVVNIHTILTFVYNSVIVALLASLLIR